MAVRPTMLPLIQRIRDMIGDLDAPFTWSDDQLQDKLDVNREVVRYAPIQPQGTPTPFTGVIQYLDFYATKDGCWEYDAKLFGPAWQPLTTKTEDYLTGHWTFAATQIPTVFIVGTLYDMYASAADVLDAWAARMSREYDFSDKQVNFKRSQAAIGLRMQAQEYRAKAWPQSFNMSRGDMTGELDPVSSSDRSSDLSANWRGD